jgi:hypothetical protein
LVNLRFQNLTCLICIRINCTTDLFMSWLCDNTCSLLLNNVDKRYLINITYLKISPSLTFVNFFNSISAGMNFREVAIACAMFPITWWYKYSQCRKLHYIFLYYIRIYSYTIYVYILILYMYTKIYVYFLLNTYLNTNSKKYL